LSLAASTQLVVGSAAVIVLVICGCSAALGSSGRTFVEDILMVVLTESTSRLLVQSPVARTLGHGSALESWSLLTGTALAALGILLNHLVRRTGGKRKKAN